MNKTMTIQWAAALMLAATMTANAQAPGAGGPQGGPGGEFQPPNPAEIAKRILTDFDADKDGKLSIEELQKSVEARHAQRQQGGPQGGPGGMRPGGPGMMQGGRGPQGGGPGGFQGGPQGGGPGGHQGGPQAGGPGGERPDPDQIAAKWLEQFDADKNGALAPEELKKALAAHRPPQGGPRGGQGGMRGPGGPGGQGGPGAGF